MTIETNAETNAGANAGDSAGSNAGVLLVRDDGATRYITINRPDAYNSLNRELRGELIDAFVEAGRLAMEGKVRAVVLGASGKAFCSGQDLKEQLQDMKNKAVAGKVVKDYNPMLAALLNIPVPVIAAVNGPAAGAGWGLAMACDFRVVSTAASFKGAFSTVGLTADTGLSATLVNAVGRAKALEILLLDEKISAEQAYDLGFVTSLVIPEEFEEAVAALATKMASGPTASYVETKQLVKRIAEVTAAATEEGLSQDKLGYSQDHLEAIQAFLEKRPPEFTGK
ncbi:MAG TPA: enoyl-CoA hydratase/isomerase family protein [Candidatus Corynebacterium gallistercoris]|uniref:Enoyl-CoA hydratase/isomerase family protein n=1 Tax=Candidatus Corynebacterium gallistercoris TaxID=2838530 RepID=A0A9D1RYK3_9CORY|nr:enoyl-CoA hydratase/isomerase family protein [Candidatus Corynebacterium gallistercoris]